MNQILNTDPNTLRLKYKMDELKGLRKIMDYLYDGYQPAFAPMYFIKSNYKEWQKIFVWLKRNEIKGKKLVEFFQNESPEDGGGYHLGVTTILSKIKGHKNYQVGIKIDELR